MEKELFSQFKYYEKKILINLKPKKTHPQSSECDAVKIILSSYVWVVCHIVFAISLDKISIRQK